MDCWELTKFSKIVNIVKTQKLSNYQKLSKLSKIVIIVKIVKNCQNVGHVMFPHHSDQMSQSSQVSRVPQSVKSSVHCSEGVIDKHESWPRPKRLIVLTETHPKFADPSIPIKTFNTMRVSLLLLLRRGVRGRKGSRLGLSSFSPRLKRVFVYVFGVGGWSGGHFHLDHMTTF